MQEKSLIEHLNDIKVILIRLILIFLVLFCLFFYYSNIIFDFILVKLGGADKLKLIFKDVAGGLSAKVFLSFAISIIILLPYVAVEVFYFSKPAFNIKLSYLLIFIASNLLYFLSQILTFLFILPIFLEILTSFGFFGVDFYIDANLYISFILKILLVFAILFQSPIVLMMLIKLNILQIEFLKSKRRVIFVLSFVVGAILTPPDVISQITVALIIYILFELTLVIASFIKK